MIKHFFSHEFVAFLITGGIAAAINFGSRIVYSHWFGFSTAIILAYISGMIAAFILARLFVFKDARHSTSKSALLFTLVNIVGIFQTWLVSLGLADYVLPELGFDWYPQEVAHLAGIMVPVFSSYLGHKYWSFGR